MQVIRLKPQKKFRKITTKLVNIPCETILHYVANQGFESGGRAMREMRERSQVIALSLWRNIQTQ